MIFKLIGCFVVGLIIAVGVAGIAKWIIVTQKSNRNSSRKKIEYIKPIRKYKRK